MIQGCVIFYNDGPDLLERCLKSLKGKVDRIIAVDGRYAEFPSLGKNWSTDGCQEIADKYADEVVVNSPLPWADQIAKRNRYLTLRDSRSYYFILDADEYFEGELPRNASGDVYSFNIYTHMDGHREPMVGCAMRLIRHQHGIKYDVKHAFIWVDGKIINRHEYLPNGRIQRLECGKIHHTPHARPVKWNQADGEYLRNRRENFADDPPLYHDSIRYEHDLMRLRCNLDRYGGFDRVLKKNIQCVKDDFILVSLEEGDSLLNSFGRKGFTFHGVLKKLEREEQCQPTN